MSWIKTSGWLIPLSLLLVVSCTEDRTFPLAPDNNTVTIVAGTLKINEFVASGSTQTNEFGTTEDWFEIYNPNNDTIHLGAYRWHFSDGTGEPTKWTLTKDTFILPQGYLMVWCDNVDMVATQIHTSFALSAAGEEVVVSYTQENGDLLIVDSYPFTNAPSAQSIGRLPDGADNWVIFPVPTPNASNDTLDVPPPPDAVIDTGSLLINEILAKGSQNINEFGGAEDWFELFNPGTDTIFLEANRWHFSDDPATPDFYTLPIDTFVVPGGFLLIWCDDLGTVVTQIHTNFKLSSGGDNVVVSYTDAQGNIITIDEYTYGVMQDAISVGRQPDGSTNWMTLPVPTPNASNN